MAYDTEELTQTALEAIKEHDLVYIEEVCAFLPCSRRVYFDHKLHECDILKDAINNNRVSIKAEIRKGWKKDGNATTQIALYKILGNEDERDALNGSQKANVEGDIKVTVTREVIKSEVENG